jgi:hypothetical protein
VYFQRKSDAVFRSRRAFTPASPATSPIFPAAMSPLRAFGGNLHGSLDSICFKSRFTRASQWI